jgi:hypothetical protein
MFQIETCCFMLFYFVSQILPFPPGGQQLPHLADGRTPRLGLLLKIFQKSGFKTI